MKLMLRHKIIGLAFIAALLPVLVMLVITTIQKNHINKIVMEELNSFLRDNITQIANDVHALSSTVNDITQIQVDANLNVARRVLKDNRGISFSGEKITWKALNQYTKETSSVTLPKMTAGGVWFGNSSDFSVTTPVVDEVKKLVGGTCTIFQRMNDKGDMLRIATNVETLDIKRAIGTYIPAINPDDAPNPVISTVLKGETYHGIAFVVNAWYVTAYEPIKDKKGEIVGILYVGIKQKAIETLRNAIYNIKVGKTGYVFVLGGTGNHKGQYIISQRGEHDGDNLWNEIDKNGKYFVQSIVTKAISLKEGEVGLENYMWQNPGDPEPRKKIAALRYFKDWDWVIGASTYEDDYYNIMHRAESALSSLLLWTALGGLIILIIAIAMAFVLGNKMAKPIEGIISIAQKIAKGNLFAAKKAVDELTFSSKSSHQNDGQTLKIAREDETEQLHAAVKQMTQNLNSLLGQVQQSGIQVTTSTTEIAASARQLEATVSQQAASTNEVVASSRQISTTSQELVKTMKEVNDVAFETASLADSGRNELNEMEKTIRQLSDATGSIVSKLSIIREKTNNIDNVITTINKVADQTNLLSLNAAIEAEKAGEYGLGFSVVAREIRRLADQTAVSTLDIEHMVKEMQSAVSSGVMEMDKFSEEVRRSVENIGRLSQKLEQIIGQVQALTPRFEEVNEGMQSQSEGAQQISEAMIQLNEAIQQTSSSLREFNTATGQLNEAARGLQSEVSRFKVSE